MIETSVLLSCYKSNIFFLRKSIKSLLNQEYKNFELIIIIDGASEILSKKIYQLSKLDKRIKIIKNKFNKGLSYSLNKAFKVSKGKFIVRADDDDFSHKNRLKKQISFLKKNKKIDIIGTNAIVNLIFKKKKFITNFPITNHEIIKSLPFYNPIIHSSVCLRKKILSKYTYDIRYKKAQDYELWMRLKKNNISFFNLTEPLVTVNKLKPISFLDLKYDIKVKLNNNNFKNKLLIVLKLPILFFQVLINNYL